MTLSVFLNVGYYADSVSGCRVFMLIVCLDVGYYADSVSGCRVYAVRMSGCRVLSCQSVWILDIMFTMVYASTHKTRIVRIETKLLLFFFFLPGTDASVFYA